MTRDQRAIAAIRFAQAEIEDGATRRKLDTVIEILSSPCAYGEPIAGWRGWQHKDWKQVLSSPRHPGKDCCREVQVFIFAPPAEETLL